MVLRYEVLYRGDQQDRDSHQLRSQTSGNLNDAGKARIFEAGLQPSNLRLRFAGKSSYLSLRQLQLFPTGPESVAPQLGCRIHND